MRLRPGTWFSREIFDLTESYIRRRERLIPTLTSPGHVRAVFCKAKGTRVFDLRGKEYIDFHGGIATSALGHGHPKITEVQQRQNEMLDFVEGSTFDYCFDIEVGGKRYEISPAALAEKLLPIIFPSIPLSDANIFFDVTGSVGVDAGMDLGLKAVRNRKNFISFLRAFHGRHRSRDLTCSSQIQRKDYLRAVHTDHIPFPDSPEKFRAAIEALNFIPLKNVNTVWAEYLQGEGGYCWPDIYLMDELMRTLRKEGILIAFDEIQSGLYRTGKPFAFQHGNVVPDIVVAGKALGGGSVPISAVAYKKAIFDGNTLESGWYSGTWPAYPKSVASAIVFLDILQEEKLIDRVGPMAELLTKVLNRHVIHRAGEDYCRRTGFGLMQGLEFRKADGSAHPEWRDAVLKNLFEAEPVGIFTVPAGLRNVNPVIRFSPCFICTEEEMNYLDEVLTRSLYKFIKK